jgi:glucose/arabinose dehydrogenase
MSRLLATALGASALCLALAASPRAQNANPRLASGAAGNALELNDPACGPSSNASDTYWAPPARPDQTRAPFVSNVQPFRVEVVAANIDHPRSIAFLPDGKLLFTARYGAIRIIDKAGVMSAPLAGAPLIEPPQAAQPDGSRFVLIDGVGLRLADRDGKLSTPTQATPGFNLARQVLLTDVRLDRDFARSRVLYLGYVTHSADGTGLIGRVARARLSADERSLEGLKVIHEAPDLLPRRIAQARDGTLFIAAGDSSGSPGPNYQSLKSEQGKVLRIDADGSIPRDNPFVGKAGADPAVYAYGFRDVHGLQIDAATGDLWTAENGPKGGDELNIIRSGRNYGYPLISYGRDNTGAPINGGGTAAEGLEQPAYYWSPSIAPSSLAFYDGTALPGWKSSLFVGAMSGLQLVRLQLKDGRIVGEEKLLKDRCRRIRDVRQGPDGLVYVLTDETKGEILRLAPA